MTTLPSFPLPGSSSRHLLQPACPLRLFSPSWTGPTYLRPLALARLARDLDELGYPHEPPLSSLPQAPGVLGLSGSSLSLLSGLVRRAGTRLSVTFLDQPLDGDGAVPWLTPYRYLRQVLWHPPGTARSQWRRLFGDPSGQGAALPWPCSVLAVQGWVYGRGERDWRDQPRHRGVLLLSPTASQSLAALLAEAQVRDLLADPRDPLVLEVGQRDQARPLPQAWELVQEGELEQAPDPDADPEQEQARSRPRLVVRLVRSTQRLALPTPRQVPWPWEEVWQALSRAQQVQLLLQAFEPQLVQTGLAGSPFAPLLPPELRRRVS